MITFFAQISHQTNDPPSNSYASCHSFFCKTSGVVFFQQVLKMKWSWYPYCTLGHSQHTFWSATKQWNSWVVQRLTCDSAQTGDTDKTSHLKIKHSLEESRCAVPGVWNIISRFYNVLLLTVNPMKGTTPEVSTDNKKEEEYCQLFVQWDKILQSFCYSF